MIKEFEGFSVQEFSSETKIKQCKWFLIDVYNNILHIPIFLKKLISYIPIIWNDRDDHWTELLNFMQFKLSQMKKSHELYSLNENKEQIIAEIHEVQTLINNICVDTYNAEKWKYLDLKYGPLVLLKQADPNIPFPMMKITRKKCLDNETLFLEESNEVRELNEQSAQLMDKDFKLLWELFQKNSQNWWY